MWRIEFTNETCKKLSFQYFLTHMVHNCFAFPLSLVSYLLLHLKFIHKWRHTNPPLVTLFSTKTSVSQYCSHKILDTLSPMKPWHPLWMNLYHIFLCIVSLKIFLAYLIRIFFFLLSFLILLLTDSFSLLFHFHLYFIISLHFLVFFSLSLALAMGSLRF